MLFNGDTPVVAMSALSVFFTTLVGALLGLRSADAAALDLVRAYGGGHWQQLRRVRLVAALPTTLAALRVAAPAALLGAIIGEYLGRVTEGLGIAMIISETQLNVARTWAIALVGGAVAGTAYGLTALVERYALPWAHAAAARGDAS
jgi:ABC-type nitrate/sulfonate/bicarbonate transport system permease component